MFHVAFCCNGVPFGGGGALSLRHSGTVFTGVLLATDLKGVGSTPAFVFLHCSHSSEKLAPWFLMREKVCGSTISHSEKDRRKTTSHTKFTSEI